MGSHLPYIHLLVLIFLSAVLMEGLRLLGIKALEKM